MIDPQATLGPRRFDGPKLSLPLVSLDVDAALAEQAARLPTALDWRHCTPDLLTLLNLDSSLQARLILARELGYASIVRLDTAIVAMDKWLHAEILTILRSTHGVIPNALRTTDT